MKLGGISSAQFFSTKTGNIALVLAGAYFCAVSLVLSGVIDYPNMILGLTFIGVAIINARGSPAVVSGLLVGFLGLVNLLAIANVLPISFAWVFAAVCALGIAILEFGGVKFGKISQKAKIAVVIPMMSLFFMFVLAIAGVNPALTVDWAAEPMKFINYIALMLLTGFLSFDLLGWRLLKKNHGIWLTALGVICVVTSFMGVYQGTLVW